MAALLHPRAGIAIRSRRAFTTTARCGVSLQLDKNEQELVKDIVPEYPYGSPQWYKQSRFGLYGGQKIQFGNNVGEKFGVKTRRTWHPNVKTKKLWSNALNGSVQLRVTTRTLRTIDKLGGLDEYLLGEKESRIKELGETGWWLRWAIMQTPAIQKRFAQQRKELGVPHRIPGIDAPEIQSADTEVVTSVEVDTNLAATPQLRSVVKPASAFRHARIRFRTGRRKHLTLTADGWRRARPYNAAGAVYRQQVQHAALKRFHETTDERIYQAMTRKQRREAAKRLEPKQERSARFKKLRDQILQNHGAAFKRRRPYGANATRQENLENEANTSPTTATQ